MIITWYFIKKMVSSGVFFQKHCPLSYCVRVFLNIRQRVSFPVIILLPAVHETLLLQLDLEGKRSFFGRNRLLRFMI